MHIIQPIHLASIMQVALVPSMVFQNSYVKSPQGQLRSPTAAQIPTTTRATIALNISNPGSAPILVRS